MVGPYPLVLSRSAGAAASVAVRAAKVQLGARRIVEAVAAAALCERVVLI